MFRTVCIRVCLLALWFPAVVFPGDKPPTSENALYERVIANPIRTAEDRQADPGRHPMDFLTLTSVGPGMKVLDVAAGGGYTTQLLALAVGDQGTVWAQADKLRPGLVHRLELHPQKNIITVSRPYDDPVPEGVSGLDLVTIIMNYHDLAYQPVDRNLMNQRLFKALKPGGHLVLIDHAAKTGTGTHDSKTLHRIDESVVRDELLHAGFMLETESRYLRNPGDVRDQPFFRMSEPSDKFALRFVKPFSSQ